MSENPLFSVLMANYNNGRFLMEAVDSMKAQTYPNWEIILVDDGSTDQSHELYKQLEQDPRIHIFLNGKNKGCGYTKRLCAELANGELCGFLDPDDALLPEALSSHVEVQLAHPEVSSVFSRYYICEGDLETIKSESRYLQIPEGESYFTLGDYRPEAFVSYKSTMYKQTEGIAEDIKMGVDQDLVFKLEEVGKVFVLNKITYKYRIHKGGISHSSTSEDVYWNLVVRHRTCMRRQLNPSDYPIRDFNQFVKNTFNEGADYARLSRPYRVGKSVLKPFFWLKKK